MVACIKFELAFCDPQLAAMRDSTYAVTMISVVIDTNGISFNLNHDYIANY